jgi:hypothetical protein
VVVVPLFSKESGRKRIFLGLILTDKERISAEALPHVGHVFFTLNSL